MDAATSSSLDSPGDELPPPALLRGTARGLEMIIQAQAPVDLVVATLTARLNEAPAFFHGSNVRVAIEGGVLAPGCLGRLEELATGFDLRIVEVGALKAKGREREAVPVAVANLAVGSAPSAARGDESGAIAADISAVLASFETSAPAVVAHAAAETPSARVEPEIEMAPGPRFVIGPIRSGVVLEHMGHLLIFGDVNPGAEVRASGSILVLGRMRGTVHAGIGQDHGFVLALRLEPQQLRIGRRVARGGDDAPPTTAEIAYVNQDRIVVEQYTGKLPRNLATSL